MSADNVQLQVGQGIIAHIQHYDNEIKRGYGFSLDKFENKKLVSHMTAMDIQYDTISDSKYHWKARNWKIRELRGLREYITNGALKDTVIIAIPSGISQAYCHLFCVIHPHHDRFVVIISQAQGRHGIVLRNRVGIEFQLYHVANRLFHIRHQCQCITDVGSMDSQYDICRNSVLLLS